MRLAIILVCLAAGMFIFGALLGASKANLPRCNEDEVLVGRGAFEQGRWTTYDCGPAIDDLWDGAPR